MPTLDLSGAPTAFVSLSDGAEIAVWDAGGEADRAVIFLHGFPQNRLCWQPVLEHLKGRGISARWIAYDLRGYGRSRPKGEASWQRFIADHLEITQQLGLDRYHLVGHDWGAAIALHVARLAPETLASASILNTTFWKIDYRGMWHMWLMNLPVVPTLLFTKAPDWFFRKTLEWAFNDPERLPAASRDSYLRMYRDPEITAFWIRLYRSSTRAILASSLPGPLRRLMTRRSVPLLRTSPDAYRLAFQIIWGVDDTFCPLWVGRSIERRLGGYGAEVEFHEVPDSGHFVTEEQPATVANLIHTWLETR